MKRWRLGTIVSILGLALLLGGCSSLDQLASDSSSSDSSTSSKATSGNVKGTYASLAKQTYKSGGAAAIKVNSGKSTLKASLWKHSKIDYGDLDSLNRTTTDTAYLSKANLGRSAGRTAQTWSPTGWHNQAIKVNGKRVYPQNRGHLIAYTLSFNLTNTGVYKAGEDGSLDNPKNLATQTAYSNQQTMQIYENQVRTALEQGKKVIYRVTTVFRGNELMPRGYWSQAISTDGSVNFNVYIWNVEPGVSFDYATGRGKADASMQVAGADKVTSSNNTATSSGSYSSKTTTSKQVEKELVKYGYKYAKKALNKAN
ncbi:DNA/RNA non-specific endonuclease [Lactiplantibacillus mudanjiangensis]|uniref:DNA/RNA non-specific endonuclease [Lactobacillus sp.] n=1 Tax=Lactiplantibacillus mudanjiangensis TaxID=1296538 RepID=A0A660DZ42_9LACO|nr:DNA/RNA non-specific endonuclease [Lactiplantibacillus mudanjiangensis]VDG20080.1 DNA/RNA non-specific endonuclease [Lactobacillus sp.] [Lactiplantibacillus mudanjiangensis]VDG26237.1 DNA/RNA non-specific endonuclease [Lactobacillus sp.] [Lactiplantibacillus mudanjiangensis]VDG27397.1 DNA/RNA non-specific endonuclease [Lactobacillus sp.] [Lactiplantibacillus mudanjiangensis]VDG33476.1 DNA/RNA non-specific endonuclease [Lactobacillus sp.] [Lactiplantibacillus mudanjiangensis]